MYCAVQNDSVLSQYTTNTCAYNENYDAHRLIIVSTTHNAVTNYTA